MSDTVDDLQAAEDLIGAVRVHLDRALDHDNLAGAGTALSLLLTWCRPSCQAEGDLATCEAEDPQTCGCPCCDHQPEETR